MSNKSIILFASLFIILSNQSNIVRADYSSPFIDDDIEAAESRANMRPLLDFDQKKVPLSEFEPGSSILGSPTKNYILMAQEALDKEDIPGLKGVSALSTGLLEDDILTYQLAKRTQFLPNELKKDESWLQTIEEKLKKWASYFPPEYYGYYSYGTPD